MFIWEVLKISLNAIRANKARAVLTTLGIIIGISAVIAMLSIGQGAQSVILDQVQSLGSNTITIIPVANFGSSVPSQTQARALNTNRLDRQIADKLQNQVRFRNITTVAPFLNGSFDASYRTKSKSVTVQGTTDAGFVVRDIEVVNGRELTAADNNKHRKVAVLGPTAAKNLFGESDPLDKTIKIKGLSFKVVGVTKERGGNNDDIIYIPLSVMGSELVGTLDYSTIIVKVDEEVAVDPTALLIEETLYKFYRTDAEHNNKFSVFTSKDILSLTSTITGIFTTLLASIAGISLVVGGIGIMNIMLVSVSERTREIGLRKAVGAKQQAILMQFLMEAVVLTLLGGIIGIAAGIGLAVVAGRLGGIPVSVTWQSILLATSVSAGIGILFGYYPAYRAAKLNPIDALRYE